MKPKPVIIPEHDQLVDLARTLTLEEDAAEYGCDPGEVIQTWCGHTDFCAKEDANEKFMVEDGVYDLDEETLEAQIKHESEWAKHLMTLLKALRDAKVPGVGRIVSTPDGLIRRLKIGNHIARRTVTYTHAEMCNLYGSDYKDHENDED